MSAFPIAVLISGSGSTLRNLLERCQDGRLPAQVCGVLASRQCPGLRHAVEFGVPAVIVPRTLGQGAASSFDAYEFSARVTQQLDRWQPKLVVLAGFLSPYLPPAHYARRVVNLHPALLPQFGGQGMYGLRVHEAVLASGTQVSGCTVHLVDEHYDHGTILAQRVVPVLAQDRAEDLARRVQQAEAELYPEVIAWFASGRLTFAADGSPILAGRNLGA